MKKERIDKILANQGISRKQAKAYIKAGSVTVNGKVCFDPDYKVDLQDDNVTCENIKINTNEHIYIMMNKPKGVVSATRDKDCATVLSLVPNELYRKGLSVAGRLDKDTTGLLILSNDGEYIHNVISPKKNVYKEYHAFLDKPVSSSDMEAFEKGIALEGKELCRPALMRILDDELKHVSVSICEGKFHQIKRMFEAVDNRVTELKRVKIGELALDERLKPGECREITKIEAQKSMQ